MDGSAAAPSYGLTREFIQCASATLTDHSSRWAQVPDASGHPHALLHS